MFEYKELLEVRSLKDFSESDQLEIIGDLFDLSFDNYSLDGIKHGFDLVRQIEESSLSPKSQVIFNYDIANGWHYTNILKQKKNTNHWNTSINETSKIIFHLRKAISLPGFAEIEPEWRCQAYTNLGNTFSSIGRFVEALEYWSLALELIPSFPMALGNKGQCLLRYGQYLFDDNQRTIFAVFSFNYIKEALTYKTYLTPDAIRHFEETCKLLDSVVPEKYKASLPDLNYCSLGKRKKLREYREWVLKFNLYLNPMNDLGHYSSASHDILHLPSMRFSIDTPPVYFTLFNEIKQQYSTARFCYYEATKCSKPHYSDIDTPIIDTLEYAEHSFYIEQLKIAFRISYSILDKIAYLLNDYLDLQIKQHGVTFKKLWYKEFNKRTLKPNFQHLDNWALKGLFWLSKDLYESEDSFDSVIEPDAKEIALIRNHIEHKGFQIISDYGFSNNDTQKDVVFNISREAFTNKVLKLLKLTRAAILYLSLAINEEESKKRNNVDSMFMPTYLGIIPHSDRL